MASTVNRFCNPDFLAVIGGLPIIHQIAILNRALEEMGAAKPVKDTGAIDWSDVALGLRVPVMPLDDVPVAMIPYRSRRANFLKGDIADGSPLASPERRRYLDRAPTADDLQWIREMDLERMGRQTAYNVAMAIHLRWRPLAVIIEDMLADIEPQIIADAPLTTMSQAAKRELARDLADMHVQTIADTADIKQTMKVADWNRRKRAAADAGEAFKEKQPKRLPLELTPDC